MCRRHATSTPIKLRRNASSHVAATAPASELRAVFPLQQAANLLITTNFPWKNNPVKICRHIFLPYFCTPKKQAASAPRRKEKNW
jgi:hypothetical protein